MTLKMNPLTREFVLATVPRFLVWAAHIPPLWTSARLRLGILEGEEGEYQKHAVRASVTEVACAVAAYQVRKNPKLNTTDYLIDHLLGPPINDSMLIKTVPAFVSMEWSIRVKFHAAIRELLDPQLDRAIHDVALAQVFAQIIGADLPRP